MTNNSEVYDSRDIVERFIQDKLENKGLDWGFHLPLQNTGNKFSSSTSSPISPSSSCRRRVSATSSGEGGDSNEGSPVVLPQQQRRGTVQAPTRRLRLQAVLQQAGAELEKLYRKDFMAQTSEHFLHLTPGLVQASLRALQGELFVDGVNWGRVVAMLEFGGAICVESAQRGSSWAIEDVAAWMVESLETPLLRRWIEDNGGWDAFVELYGQARQPVGSWSMIVIGLAVLGAAGITLGAVFTQK